MKIAVSYDDPQLHTQSLTWANKMGLPLCKEGEEDSFELLVMAREDRFVLQLTGELAPGPVDVDFLSSQKRHMKKYTVSKSQPLAKAMGLKGSPLRVLDATAGLGGDSFYFLCLGCEVWAYESHPLLAQLLIEARDRALHDPDFLSLMKRLHIYSNEAQEGFIKYGKKVDVIYLDPMFPEKSKSALAPKEMQLLQKLITEPTQIEELLEKACDSGCPRVVVKRPLRAPHLGRPPTHSQNGKSIRYDVYLC